MRTNAFPIYCARQQHALSPLCDRFHFAMLPLTADCRVFRNKELNEYSGKCSVCAQIIKRVSSMTIFSLASLQSELLSDLRCRLLLAIIKNARFTFQTQRSRPYASLQSSIQINIICTSGGEINANTHNHSRLILNNILKLCRIILKAKVPLIQSYNNTYIIRAGTSEP